MSALVVREAAAADAPGIRALFGRAFGREMTAEEWRWKFEDNPDGWFGTVVELAGRIVGNYAGWGMRFLLGGQERLVYAVGDVATDPSVRGLGGRRNAFRLMTEAFFEEVEGRRGVPFCFGFPGERHLVLGQRVVGTRTVFAIVEKRVPCGALPPPPGDSEAGDFVLERFDRLWAAASRAWPALAVRDRARANWRFHARPGRYYRMVWRNGGDGLLGWAVLSVSGEDALVADYLGRSGDGDDLLPLFAAAGAEASRLGARRLVFWETPGPAAAVLAELPGERFSSGFPLDARGVDEAAIRLLRERGHLVPALYDMV
ncbi:MAG: GNAT family N-acetyltransferase [Acidobacteriota bacterium]|nr:GNAT family N-acetyltransferase [Acidobacteriota bacterium]